MHHDHAPYSSRRPTMAASSHRNARNEYLENAVRTASPARIRLMLIDRAIDVAGILATKYRDENGPRGANEQSIYLLDLLSELLGGIANKDSELCRQVADLYVFLCQELVRAEAESSAERVDVIRDVLRIDAETWREVCINEQPAAILADIKNLNQSVTAGLNLQG